MDTDDQGSLDSSFIPESSLPPMSDISIPTSRLSSKGSVPPKRGTDSDQDDDHIPEDVLEKTKQLEELVAKCVLFAR